QNAHPGLYTRLGSRRRFGREAFADQPARHTLELGVARLRARRQPRFEYGPGRVAIAATEMTLGEPQGVSRIRVLQAKILEPGAGLTEILDTCIHQTRLYFPIAAYGFDHRCIVREGAERQRLLAIQ